MCLCESYYNYVCGKCKPKWGSTVESINREVFEDMLKNHDWHYKMSDSMKVYDKGEAQEVAIKKACKGNDELSKMYEDYKAKMGL